MVERAGVALPTEPRRSLAGLSLVVGQNKTRFCVHEGNKAHVNNILNIMQHLTHPATLGHQPRHPSLFPDCQLVGRLAGLPRPPHAPPPAAPSRHTLEVEGH